MLGASLRFKMFQFLRKGLLRQWAAWPGTVWTIEANVLIARAPSNLALNAVDVCSQKLTKNLGLGCLEVLKRRESLVKAFLSHKDASQ